MSQSDGRDGCERVGGVRCMFLCEGVNVCVTSFPCSPVTIVCPKHCIVCGCVLNVTGNVLFCPMTSSPIPFITNHTSSIDSIKAESKRGCYGSMIQSYEDESIKDCYLI